MLFQVARPVAPLTGNWTTPDHSVVKVYSCGDKTLCARLVQTTDHTAADDNNPDASFASGRYAASSWDGTSH
jgi:uncharacterized protein (DUF2147 family)